MQSIPLERCRSVAFSSAIGRFPRAVMTTCSRCGVTVTFTTETHLGDGNRDTVSCSASCPNCNARADFWCLSKGSQLSEVFMHPPASGYVPYPEFEPNVPEALQRSVVSTIDTFNSKNFTATAVLARRTLEGIFKYLVDEGQRNQKLYELIDQVTAGDELARPLKSLSHAIRSGGNLGAHFDEMREPTQEMASQMVELLVYLLSYLYTLPSKINELEARLAGAPGD